jgi:hypothetical protein
VKILALQATGVEGVPDGTYSFAAASGAPADVVVVAGPAASGKTRLLELLLLVREVIAPSNDEADEEAWVRLGNRSARVLVTFWLAEHERKTLGYATPTVTVESILGADPELVAPVEPDPGLAFLLEGYDHTEKTIKLEYFGENRRLDVGGGAISLEPQSQKAYRSTKDPRKFSFVPALLRSLRHDAERARRFQETLGRFSASCTFDPATGALASHGRQLRELSELSASEREAVIFSAVPALVTLSHSVVLVDRPALYIRDEATLYRGLTALGSSNQLFVTSHLPQLFRAAESRCVIHLQ